MEVWIIIGLILGIIGLIVYAAWRARREKDSNVVGIGGARPFDPNRNRAN